MEVRRGWTLDPDGTDMAPANARWVRGDPAATAVGGVVLQPGTTASGRVALVTGRAAGTGAWTNDLDGLTTVRSAPVTLPAGAGQQLTFRFTFAHTASGTAADHLRAIIEAEDGTQAVAWERTATGAVVAGGWRTATVSMDAWAGQTIRIRFEAVDGGADSAVEAGVDDVRVTRPSG